MIFINRFFVFCLIIFYSFTAIADEKIAYLDIDKIINNSNIGKSILLDLEKEQKIFLEKFKNIEKKLKEQEKEILSQKNLLRAEKYKEKVDVLKKKINSYNNEKLITLKEFNKKKKELTKLLIVKMNEIVAEYSNEKSYSLILKQSDIVVGKKDLNITNDILKLFNNKIKTLD